MPDGNERKFFHHEIAMCYRDDLLIWYCTLHVTRYRRYKRYTLRVTGVTDFTDFNTNLSSHISTSSHFHIISLHVTDVTRYTLQALQISSLISLPIFPHLHIFTSFRYTLQSLQISSLISLPTFPHLHIFTSFRYTLQMLQSLRVTGVTSIHQHARLTAWLFNSKVLRVLFACLACLLQLNWQTGFWGYRPRLLLFNSYRSFRLSFAAFIMHSRETW